MNQKLINKVKSDAIFEFIDLMIGAHEAGFTDKNNPTLWEIYRVAQNHVKDTMDIDTPTIVEKYGAGVSLSCGGEGLK